MGRRRSVRHAKIRNTITVFSSKQLSKHDAYSCLLFWCPYYTSMLEHHGWTRASWKNTPMEVKVSIWPIQHIVHGLPQNTSQNTIIDAVIRCQWLPRVCGGQGGVVSIQPGCSTLLYDIQSRQAVILVRPLQVEVLLMCSDSGDQTMVLAKTASMLLAVLTTI